MFLSYYANGMISLVEYHDLAFDKEEIGRLLENIGNVDEIDECSEIILNVTEGWPAGVMSVMLMLKQERKRVNKHTIVNYCNVSEAFECSVSDIFKKLTYDVQNFLVYTSLLDEISPEICNVIMDIDNSKGILDYLVSQNMFTIKLNGHKDVYRYHGIFKAYLQEQVEEGKRKNIFYKAAKFCLNHDKFALAIEYAMESDNFELFQSGLESIGIDFISERRLSALDHWGKYLLQHKDKWNTNTKVMAA